MNHAYVSSSTREGSTVKQALANYLTGSHADLVNKSGGHPGIGFWHDGAEETVHLQGPKAHEQAEAWGRYHKQKAVLVFSPTPHGPDRLHVFSDVKPSDVARVQKGLSPYATYLPKEKQIHVIEFEKSPEFLQKAKALGIAHEHHDGKAAEIATK